MSENVRQGVGLVQWAKGKAPETYHSGDLSKPNRRRSSTPMGSADMNEDEDERLELCERLSSLQICKLRAGNFCEIAPPAREMWQPAPTKGTL